MAKQFFVGITMTSAESDDVEEDLSIDIELDKDITADELKRLCCELGEVVIGHLRERLGKNLTYVD